MYQSKFIFMWLGIEIANWLVEFFMDCTISISLLNPTFALFDEFIDIIIYALYFTVMQLI
jgi:hypothetical protein